MRATTFIANSQVFNRKEGFYFIIILLLPTHVMSAGKGNKKVTVKVAGEIQIESVVSAILDRGSDDGEGAKTCSVRKIKDFLIGQFTF